WALRHARQCVGLDRGLLAHELRRRAFRRPRLDDGRRLHQTRAARRGVEQPAGLRAFGGTQRRRGERQRVRLFESGRLPRGAGFAVNRSWHPRWPMNWPTNRTVAENGPGVAASLLVHGLIFAALLFWLRHTAEPDTDRNLRTVLVDIIHLGAETTSPPAPQRSTAPSQKASVPRAPTAHSPPVGYTSTAPRPADDLDNRLDQLAKLRAPETSTEALQGAGDARAEAASDAAAAGNDALYSLRDYLRAQIERRWNVDLAILGERRIVVTLR